MNHEKEKHELALEELEKEIKKYEKEYKRKLKELDDKFNSSEFHDDFKIDPIVIESVINKIDKVKNIKYNTNDRFFELTHTVRIIAPAPHLDVDGQQNYFCELNSMGNIVYVIYSEEKLSTLEQIQD